MGDNDTHYCTVATKELLWIENIRRMNWLANSLDLNTIEQMRVTPGKLVSSLAATNNISEDAICATSGIGCDP